MSDKKRQVYELHIKFIEKKNVFNTVDLESFHRVYIRDDVCINGVICVVNSSLGSFGFGER